MKKQIAMLMAAVLAFSNAGSMMAGELIEVEESIFAEPIADDSLIVEEETALEEYAAEPAPLPDDIVIEEEALEENVIEEAPGELFIEEEITDEPLIEEELTEDYLVAEDTLIDELVEDNNEIFTEDGAVEEVEIPPLDEEIVLEEEGLSEEPALAGAASGQCGDNLSWTLDDEGVLTISGTGEMEDYGTGEWNSQGEYVYTYGPWYDSRDAIETVIIEEGVTGIGDYAFYECWNLYSVTLPESLCKIGGYAFVNCCVLPHIEIPDQVTELGACAFSNCDNLKNVKLSQGLTDIQTSTFSDCVSLSDITIPEGVTYIRPLAFYKCSELKSVDIPEGVSHIGYSAFCDCKSLTSVTVPESVTKLEDQVFENCDNLVSVSLPSGLAAIEEQLFYGCHNLENLTIPDNVESIGTNSFNHSGITDIIIPESVKSIGGSAFYYSDLKTITFKGDAPTFEPGSFGSVTVTAYYPEEKAGWTEEVRQNYGGTITWIPYSEEIELSTRDVTLVESETETVTVKILNDDAIVSWSSANTDIASVDANGTITGTGLGKTVITAAFQSGREETVNVTVYGEIELGTKTVEIKEKYSNVYFRYIPIETGCYCFSGNYGDELGLYDEGFHKLFYTNYAHKTITYMLEAGTTYYFSVYRNNVSTVVNITLEKVTGFGQCGDNLSWELKDTTLTISGTGDMWNWDGDEYGIYEYPWFEFQSVIKEVIIEEGVTSIGDHAFSQCDITKVTVPSTVTYIGVSAFSHCYSLSDITIPVSLKRIEDYTFTQCEKLKSINIPPSVTSIGESAFAYSDLHEITIPNSVTSIGNYAFAGCDFTRVTIPNSLENIGEYVFSGCDKLRNVTFPVDMTAIEAGMFYECYMLNNVTIPEGVMSIGDRAFASCNALSTISIPGSVTSIGNEAFSWCGKLNSILLSEGLENIGESAFQYTDLENVILPTSLMSIGKNAFWNCHFRSITIPENVVSIGDGAFVYCPLNEIVFNGNAPVFVTDEGADASTCFKDITANAYYFWGKNWPSDVQQNYGGTITWIANNPDIKTESKLWVGKDESESIIVTILNDDSIVSYSSGNPEIAEVDDSGIITGIKDGETTITITFQSGYETTVDVSVITGLHPIKLGVTTTANIEEYEGHAYFSYIPAVTDTYYFFSISGTYNTYGKVYDDEFNMLASGYSGEWIDDFKVPYLLEAGKRYYFEASFYDDIGSFDVRLECTPFFELSTKELKVTENESETISVSILNDDRIASWSSDDPSVAIVDENGTVTGVSVGNTVITLTFESGWQEKINIEVKKGIHPIELGVLTNVDIKESEEYTYFSFVPAESAEYVFYSLSDEDTYGYLYDADFEQLYSNDDGGENRNFKITKYLDAGTQYFFGAKFYGQETGSFTVRLIKYIDNELNARAKNSEIHVAPGENAEMEVEATTDAGSITYKWYDEEWSEIEGANEAVYIANNITYYSEYYCRVSDEYGNSITVEFAVKIDNGITAEAKNAEITVAPGENAEMEVEATTDAGSITYQWYYTGDEIEGANEAIYVANNITYRSEYSCRVFDDYGNETTVKFTVKIDNGLTAKAKNYQITVAPGDSATLEVEAHCTYGELYYEWRDYRTSIEGASGTAYLLLENIMESTPLINCLVSDEYGNHIEVGFNVLVNNEFNAHAVTGSLRIAPGESATMEVNATCKKGAITYKWFDSENNIIEGEVEPVYSVEKVNKSTWYRCVVGDEYGSWTWVYFTVYVENGFTAKAVPSSSIKVAPGETAVMKVGASCTLGKISYQWYGEHDTLIKGATKASYSVKPANPRSIYYCRALDEYGNSSTIYFSVRMDTGFAYEAASDTFFAVSRGDSIDLSVKAQNKYGNINYSWERRSGNTTQWTPLEGETAASYTTPGVEENCFYRCTIKNEYGESGIVSFEIHIVSEGIKPIELDTDTDAVISAGGEYAFFSFVPSETDFYSFYSTADQDTYGYLYDSNFKQITSDDDSGTDSNFEIVRKLEAGKQYYYGVRFFRDWTTGSFTVRLEHRAVFGSGQSSDGLFWRFEEGVLTISGTGSNWYELQAGYNAYRGDITKVVVEEGVTSLGSYAFGKCPKLQEAELPDSLFSIGSYAFTECPALTAVTIPVGVNYIYDMAFSACSGLKEITFKGDAPTFYWGEMGGYSQFTGVTANANYPAMNKTWIEGVRGDYGGTLTWKPDGFLEGSVKASDINLKVNTKKSQSAQIKVTENVSEGALTYRSDNEKVAVDAKGKVTVEAGFTGFATITIESAATDTYIEAFTTITVNVLFSDVTDPETQFYYDYVYWAANSGITTGYNDGSFGPLKDCNRAAVVTFLWRMAGKPEPGSMATFKDMTNNPDFDKAISWALENGITTGYEKDNTFRPWNPCNRAAIVTFLWRYAGSPEPKTMATFNDMTNNKDFDKAISWAAENGITTGYEKDNTFRPWNTCNRLAVVSFLARYDAL